MFQPRGRIETRTAAEREEVIKLFTGHYSMHPLIHFKDRLKRNAAEIHSICCWEMYDWCRGKGYFRAWAYMWVKWYGGSSLEDEALPSTAVDDVLVHQLGDDNGFNRMQQSKRKSRSAHDWLTVMMHSGRDRRHLRCLC